MLSWMKIRDIDFINQGKDISIFVSLHNNSDTNLLEKLAKSSEDSLATTLT